MTFFKQEETNFLTISKVFIHIFWVDYGEFGTHHLNGIQISLDTYRSMVYGFILLFFIFLVLF